VSNLDASLSSATINYYRISYLGRLNYNFDSKYLFSASIRTDASSRFGKNKRWGTFPSVSVGWNLAKEAFLSNVPYLSNLKLRASWVKPVMTRLQIIPILPPDLKHELYFW
jgi:hypothetical protein